MTVNDFNVLSGFERHSPGKKFIKCDPQRIKITAIIERAVHPAGLLRRDIEKIFPVKLGAQSRQIFPGKTAGLAEAGQFDGSQRRINKNIQRVDHFMYNALLVHFFQGAGK